MSTKLLSVLALIATLGFTVLVILQVVELSHYKEAPVTASAAPAAPAPAPEAEAAPAAEAAAAE